MKFFNQTRLQHLLCLYLARNKAKNKRKIGAYKMTSMMCLEDPLSNLTFFFRQLFLFHIFFWGLCFRHRFTHELHASNYTVKIKYIDWTAVYTNNAHAFFFLRRRHCQQGFHLNGFNFLVVEILPILFDLYSCS